jgi:hypothetical protein
VAIRTRRCRTRRAVLGATITAAVGLSLGPAAFADTYADPTNAVIVGTNGSDAHGAWVVAVSQGGCAWGNTAVAIGESNKSCPGQGHDWGYGHGDAEGTVAVGLLGGEAAGYFAVADTGGARACQYPGTLSGGCLETPPLAVSGTGPADAWIAVSGTGTATSPFGYAVSGTGNANSAPCWWDGANTAISGTGNATGCTAVSATGSANGEQTAVSGTVARRAAGHIAFHGEAVLPRFPCPWATGCTGGRFSGSWTGEVAGTHLGSAFAVNWTTLTGPDVGADFTYWESACLVGSETLVGRATGTGSAIAASNEVIGWWQQRDEAGVRAVVGVRFGFGFDWDRYLNSAVIDLRSTTLTLTVAGLGDRTVVSGPQAGSATFVLTGADNTAVPTCGTPLVNARGRIAGGVPLTIATTAG